MLTHFSTFSGIGGMDLAAEAAGFQTIGQVEKADYPFKVLSKHWPDVPKWRDVRDVTIDAIRNAGIGPVTVLSGGFPCQPFSTAGKRKGKDDDRYFWPEMLRVIKLIEPSWVVGENVNGFIDLALDSTIADLENIGYSVRSFCIPACSIGAPHKRYRVFIIANINDMRCNNGPTKRERIHGKSTRFKVRTGNQFASNFKESWFEVATKFCGVVHGVSDRVDRIKCLGNAVVPQQVYPIFKIIADIESVN